MQEIKNNELQLDDVNGLDLVKSELKSYFQILDAMKKRQEFGLKVPQMTSNLIFCCDILADAITIAKCVTTKYYSIGKIKDNKLIVIDGKELVIECNSKSDTIIKDVLSQASGGVLLINNVEYLFNSINMYGCVKTLDAIYGAIIHNDGDVVVIFSGNKEFIEKMEMYNPIFKTKFYQTIFFIN